MAIIDVNKIAPDSSQKILLGLTIIFWFISFSYYSPEDTKILLDSVGLYNIAPSYDLPTIIPLLLFIWMIVGLIDATYIHLKVMSDVAIAEGMDNCESCVGGKLHVEGDWGWIRVGGTKAFPIDGSAVWIGLRSHIHKYQDYITPITKSPDTYEKKGFLWARAGFDALMSGSSNEIYISKKEYTAKVAHNIILKGAIQKVSQQYLYEYIGKDLNLLKEIIENPIIWVNKKGKL